MSSEIIDLLLQQHYQGRWVKKEIDIGTSR